MKIESASYTKRKDIIIMQFPLEQYTLDEAKQMMENVQKIFPENNILCLPIDISLAVLREENPFL